MQVGRLKEIWRYPVKSLGGGTVDSAFVHDTGIAGDRGWTTVDTRTGDMCSAKRAPGLLNLSARYLREPKAEVSYKDDVPPVLIGFPDGRELEGVDQQSAAMSEFLGFPVQLHPLEPPENKEHYRMASPPSEEQFARMLGIKPGDDSLDMGEYDPKLLEFLMEYSAIPGTYYDAFPLHMITTAALEHMRDVSSEDYDVRRFRPNLVIETVPDVTGLAEFDWTGKGLKIGDVQLKIESRTLRCSMPSRAQECFGLKQNPLIAKSLHQTTNRFLGVNLTVQKGGMIYAGSAIELVS
ncbi:MAG: MOSC N-terminal beta barrel domain-containing protein [Pseudomonadota bacterium]